MDSLNTCIAQRQKEQQRGRKVFLFGLITSTLFHIGLILTITELYKKPTQTEDSLKPIELIIVEQPKPEVPKPKETPKPVPVPIASPTTPTQLPQPITPPKPISPPKQTTVTKPQPISPVSQNQPVSKPTTAPQPDQENPKPIVNNSPQTTPLNLPATNQPQPSLNDNSQPVSNSSQGTEQPITSAPVARTQTPPAPSKPEAQGGGISCISSCQPSYPSVLNGAEGSATVNIVVDATGNIVSVTLTRAHSNSQINQQALLAARNMRFTPPSTGNSVSVQVTINFTVAGSEFDRQAREKREQLERERIEQEKIRNQQLEQERLERARQQKLEQQRQTQPEIQQPEPSQELIPSPTETEEEEILRKFRERINRN